MPRKPRPAPAPPTRAPIPETALTTPHPPVARAELAPLTTWDTFVAAHQQANRQRDDYLHLGYRSRASLDAAAQAELDPRAAFTLPANNMSARIRYAYLMGVHLERLALSLPPDVPTFFVTLCNREHTVPLAQARGFELARVTGWTHHILQGAHYVGMVEGAYYSNLPTLSPLRRRYLSWHTHAVLWGLTEEELIRRRDDANRRYKSAVPGRTAVHYRCLPLNQVFGQGIYQSKGQINEYRVWPIKTSLTDDETGEFSVRVTGDYRAGKRPLRLGDAVRLCRAFADRQIDSLAFAACDGRAVLAAINHEALAPFCAWERRQPYTRVEDHVGLPLGLVTPRLFRRAAQPLARKRIRLYLVRRDDAGEQMAKWAESKCVTYYGAVREAAEEPCEVVITEERIAVDTRHVEGGWHYEGTEVAPGHFELKSTTHDGWGTLHRCPGTDELEGWWEQDKEQGMWRITLGPTDNE